MDEKVKRKELSKCIHIQTLVDQGYLKPPYKLRVLIKKSK